MSDFGGVFEVLAADDSDARLASRRALVLSETRINEKLGEFLKSRSVEEFDARLSYVEDDFKGIISVACEEVGHGKPEVIYTSLKAHYRPSEPRVASVHESRKPRMCPYHSEVVDISLASDDPSRGYEVMQSHAWGSNHCQGDWEGKCGFKREMVTQSYWDDHQKSLDERREERQNAEVASPPEVEDVAPPTEPTDTQEESAPEGSPDSNVIEFPSPDGMVDSGGSAIAEPQAVAASTHEADYKYVKKQGDKWVIIQKGTGKVLSEHDSEEKAKSAFRAMEMHKHEGSAREALTRKDYNLLAGAIKSAPIDNHAEVAGHFADHLADTNERFDRDRFINASTPETDGEEKTADYNPSDQKDESSKSVPCPECGGDGKTNGGKTCPRCKGQGHVNDWGPSTLDAVSSKTADKGNTDLGGPEPKMDKRKWTPQNVRKVEVPSEQHPTKEKDPIEPIKAVNDDPLTEIGEKTTERVELPAAGDNLDDSGFASNNMDKGQGTQTWKGTDGQASPVTKETISKADDVNRNPIRDLLTADFDGFVSPSVIERVTTS